MATDPRDKIISDLKANTSAAKKNAAEADRLLRARDRLFLRARAATPPVTVREIAKLTGLAEVSVNKRLKQLRTEADAAGS